MFIDNFDLVLPFAPERDDGDTFIYTELLDRSKRAGNNSRRLLKTFYHRSRDELAAQMPDMRRYCDMLGVRACTRVSPRSAKKVGKEFGRLVMQAITDENWWGLKAQYGSACGRTNANQKIWLWDVDEVNDESSRFGDWLADEALLIATIPSKKGLHYLTLAFDRRLALTQHEGRIALHEDNPTNLYIPDGAA